MIDYLRCSALVARSSWEPVMTTLGTWRTDGNGNSRLRLGDALTVEYKTITETADTEGMARVIVFGSLHKWSKRGSNAGDFTLDEVRVAAIELCALLRIDPDQLRLSKIEFGVNVPAHWLDFGLHTILDAMCDVRGTPYRDFAGKVIGKISAVKSNRTPQAGSTRTPERRAVKVYVKQDEEQNEVMRVELRLMKSYWKSGGMIPHLDCLADLVEPTAATVEAMHRQLVRYVSLLTFWLNPIPALDDANADFARASSVPSYWHGLSGRPRDRAKVKRRKLEDKTGAPDLGSVLAKAVTRKWHELDRPPISTIPPLPPAPAPEPGGGIVNMGDTTIPPLPQQVELFSAVAPTSVPFAVRREVLKMLGIDGADLTPKEAQRHCAGRCVACGKRSPASRRGNLTCNERCKNIRRNAYKNTGRQLARAHRDALRDVPQVRGQAVALIEARLH